MSTAMANGQRASQTDGLSGYNADKPPISAIFVIHFDLKAGYTLGWQRSLPFVELEGVVEYKSLPSGLHNVEHDLIYFVNEAYAGLSAFVNQQSKQAERNANMLAVGILVPLSFGRLGRSWKHADALQTLVRDLLPDVKKTEAIEKYWETYKQATEDPTSRADSPVESPSSLKFKPSRQKQTGDNSYRKMATSEVDLHAKNSRQLSPHHPALSLRRFFDSFGPLVFPLYRAALLRKRILIVTQAPVELACNYVYNISILSNIPSAVNELLTPVSPGPRLKPLFVVGVHDIPYLQKDKEAMEDEQFSQDPSDESVSDQLGTGWVACTTDEILAMKLDLYDIIIKLPPHFSESAASKAWPDIKDATGVQIRATQRDLRRFNTVSNALSRLEGLSKLGGTPDEDIEGQSINSNAKLLPSAEDATSFESFSPADCNKILEPMSWSALAYSSYMWWASAGETRQDIVEEEERDMTLFEEPFDVQHPITRRPRSRSSLSAPLVVNEEVEPEMALIAYFHRLTSLTLSTLANIQDSAEEDEEDQYDENADDPLVDPPVFVSGDEMAKLGLDVWSASDRRFVEDILETYFDRKAEVPGGNIECCGVQLAQG